MRVSQWSGCLAGFACVAAGFVTAVQSQGVGSYTEAQAIAGRTAYNQSCVECHLGDLRGGFGPPLVGPNFINVWGTREARVLFEQVKNTIPPGSEASLSDSTYIDIVAYILEVNGHAAGAEALRVDSPRAIDPGAAGASDDAPDEHGGPRAADRQLEVPSAGPVALVNREVTSSTPVTDELLRDPPDGEWLSWRRTLDGQGYSPLDRLTPENVDELRLAWVWTMEQGRVQTPPLVHDGVMYLANPNDVLQALDAKTGDIIGQYRRVFPEGPRSNLMRTIALYQDKIFMTTADVAIIAVDARTGALVWETPKADVADGFYHTPDPPSLTGL